MFASIVHYRLNPIFEKEFLKLWKEQNELLRANEAIVTNFLHRETKISYVAYMRWREKSDFEQLFLQPQGKLELIKQKLEECCNSINIPYRLMTLSPAS